jgi:hypothetical protein
LDLPHPSGDQLGVGAGFECSAVLEQLLVTCLDHAFRRSDRRPSTAQRNRRLRQRDRGLAHALQLDEAERGILIRQTCHPAIATGRLSTFREVE